MLEDHIIAQLLKEDMKEIVADVIESSTSDGETPLEEVAEKIISSIAPYIMIGVLAREGEFWCKRADYEEEVLYGEVGAELMIKARDLAVHLFTTQAAQIASPSVIEEFENLLKQASEKE